MSFNGLSSQRCCQRNGCCSPVIVSQMGLTGPTGPIGPTGPAGSTAATIPFSVSKYGTHLSTDETGDPQMVVFSGFGPAYSSGEFLLAGEWDTGTITIRDDMFFGAAFIMPHDGLVRNIYVMFTTASGVIFEPGSIIRPFVCLATSSTNDLLFTILQDTMTFTEPYAGGVDHRIHTTRRGSLLDANVNIPQGTLVAIIAGIMGDNVTQEQYGMFSVSGGIFIE